jgi:hypothetical protein
MARMNRRGAEGWLLLGVMLGLLSGCGGKGGPASLKFQWTLAGTGQPCAGQIDFVEVDLRDLGDQSVFKERIRCSNGGLEIPQVAYAYYRLLLTATCPPNLVGYQYDSDVGGLNIKVSHGGTTDLGLLTLEKLASACD